MLPFSVHKIFTFYINGVLNCKCPAPGPKVKLTCLLMVILQYNIITKHILIPYASRHGKINTNHFVNTYAITTILFYLSKLLLPHFLPHRA